MTVVTTRILAGADHKITGTVSDDVPPGEHDAVIPVPPRPPRWKAARPFNMDALPTVDLGPWP